MDDLERLRIRFTGILRPTPDELTLGSPSFVGQVKSAGANLAVGKFFLANPVSVLGTEVEGGPGTFSVNSATVPVYLLGPKVPATGDYLVCRFVDFRWVAEAGKANPPNLGITFTIEQPCPQGGLNRYTVPYKITSIVDPDGTERVGSTQSSSALVSGKAGVWKATVAGITTPDSAGQFFTFADPVTVNVTVDRPASGNSVSVVLIGPAPSTYTARLVFDVDSDTVPRASFLTGSYAISGDITKNENFNYQQNNPDNPTAGATSTIRVMVTLSDPLGLKNATFAFASGPYQGTAGFSYAFCRGMMQNNQNVDAIYVRAPYQNGGGPGAPPGGPTGAG